MFTGPHEVQFVISWRERIQRAADKYENVKQYCTNYNIYCIVYVYTYNTEEKMVSYLLF